jgi:hypothetical protein
MDPSEITTMKRLLTISLLLLPGLALANDIPGMSTWTINGWTIAFWGIVYMLPSIVALLRNTNMVLLVILVNFFLGWTTIGWIVALIMAVKGKPNTWRPKKIKARQR